MQNIMQSKHFKLMVFIGVIALSGLIWLGKSLYNHYYVSTEDAYVNANIVQVTPRVTGIITAMPIVNNQYVKKGQLLFVIDRVPFATALAAAEAQVEMNEAQLTKATLSAQRTLTLVKRNYSSPQDGDNATADLKTARAALESAKANYTQAKLNLAYTEVRAPVNGWVSNMSLQNGDVVTANQALFALISNEEFWVDANFKETEMQFITPGQTARITTDLYPGHAFKGIVESISSGAGTAFSLLPPQNATGNWVKVTQRVPIRIRILNPDMKHQLRVGISATVTVDLKHS